MKTTLATALLLCASIAAFGQGTIFFGNGFLTRAKVVEGVWGPTGITFGSTNYVPTTPGLINYGVFFGTSSDALSLVPTLGHNSTAVAGIIDVPGSPSTFAIPGTHAGDTVWMQIKGWDGTSGSDWQSPTRYYAETAIVQVQLMPTEGPGTVIWKLDSDPNPNKFYRLMFLSVPEPGPLAQCYSAAFAPIPEPGALALGGVGAAIVLLWRRGCRRP